MCEILKPPTVQDEKRVEEANCRNLLEGQGHRQGKRAVDAEDKRN